MADDKIKTKIGRGVAKAEAERKGRPVPRLLAVAGQKIDPTNIANLLNASRNSLAKLTAVRNSAQEAFATQKANILEHYNHEGFLVGDGGRQEDILGPERRRAMVVKSTNDARKVIYSSIEEDVTKHMIEVRAQQAAVKLAQEYHSDPISFLMTSTLGDPKRATYAANLHSAGPRGIKGAAMEAIQTQNVAQGAAVCAAIEALPKKSRDYLEFSRDEVAEALVNDAYFTIADQLVVADFILSDAELTGREGLGRDRTSTDTMAMGLRRKKAEEFLGREMTQEDLAWKPVRQHVVQDVTAQTNDASKKAAETLAAAKELADKNVAFANAKYGSDEWVRLGRELGHGIEEENTGEPNE